MWSKEKLQHWIVKTDMSVLRKNRQWWIFLPVVIVERCHVSPSLSSLCCIRSTCSTLNTCSATAWAGATDWSSSTAGTSCSSSATPSPSSEASSKLGLNRRQEFVPRQHTIASFFYWINCFKNNTLFYVYVSVVARPCRRTIFVGSCWEHPLCWCGSESFATSPFSRNTTWEMHWASVHLPLPLFDPGTLSFTHVSLLAGRSWLWRSEPHFRTWSASAAVQLPFTWDTASVDGSYWGPIMPR